MQRKAKAGHVTGGRVFGYDNINISGLTASVRMLSGVSMTERLPSSAASSRCALVALA